MNSDAVHSVHRAAK